MPECACWDYSIDNWGQCIAKRIIHCCIYEIELKMAVGRDGIMRTVDILGDIV